MRVGSVRVSFFCVEDKKSYTAEKRKTKETRGGGKRAGKKDREVG